MVCDRRTGGGGTVRCVDSSVERLEVPLDGLQRTLSSHAMKRMYRCWNGSEKINMLQAFVRACSHPAVCIQRYQSIVLCVLKLLATCSIGACTYYVADLVRADRFQ